MFRAEDYTSRELILNDPYTVVRGRPGVGETAGWGPHDVLGFRNRAVPAAADVVVIGDSQSYGNNALLESNWPSRMEHALPAPGASPTAPPPARAAGNSSTRSRRRSLPSPA